MQVVKADQKLHQIISEINQCVVGGAKCFLRIGALLKAVRDENLWQLSGAVTFHEWAEREIRFKRSHAYSCIACYEKYQHLIEKDPMLLNIEQSRLVKLLPYANGDERTEELLHMAKEADAIGFDNNLKELRGTKAPDTCEHPIEEQEEWQKCKRCGIFHKITDIG